MVFWTWYSTAPSRDRLCPRTRYSSRLGPPRSKGASQKGRRLGRACRHGVGGSRWTEQQGVPDFLRRMTLSTMAAHADCTSGQTKEGVSSDCRSSSHRAGMRRRYTAVVESRSMRKAVWAGMCAGRTRATYSMQASRIRLWLRWQKSVWASRGAVRRPWTDVYMRARWRKPGRFTVPPW
jgi:hypothetical protein